MSSESWLLPGTVPHAVLQPEEGGSRSLGSQCANLLRNATGPEDQSASESRGGSSLGKQGHGPPLHMAGGGHCPISLGSTGRALQTDKESGGGPCPADTEREPSLQIGPCKSEHPCIFHYGISGHSVPPNVIPAAHGRGCVGTCHGPHPCRPWMLGQCHRQKTLQKKKKLIVCFYHLNFPS